MIRQRHDLDITAQQRQIGGAQVIAGSDGGGKYPALASDRVDGGGSRGGEPSTFSATTLAMDLRPRCCMADNFSTNPEKVDV